MKKVNFVAMLLFLCAFTSFAQDKQTMTGMFEGHNGTAFSFSYGDDEYIYFNECDKEVLKEFDLYGDDLLYEMFTVTYITEENEDGDPILKIIGLVHIPSEDED